VIKDGDVVATTDRDGNYRFTNVKPGKYTIEQVQPGRSLDGADTPEAPVTNKVVNNTVVNDQFYVDIGVHPVTGVLGGLTSLNNNYAELGLLPGAGYPSVFQLLASSGGQPGGYESWILFGMNTAPWQAYSPAGWKSYSNASLGSIVRDAQGKVTSAVLKVRDDGTGAFKEKTVTTASGRLRVSADQQIFTIMGSASDMFAAAGEGEQSGGAAMDAYRRGVDAVFAEAGSGSSEIA
jgi:hypothetical protein